MEREFRYDIARDSGATVEAIRASARKVWGELHQPGSLAREEAERAGIPLDDVPEDMEEALSLKPSGAGFEPASVALVVTGMLLHGAGRASLDIWKYVLLPRIREKWGDRALKDQKTKAVRSAAQKGAARTAAKRVLQKKAQNR